MTDYQKSSRGRLGGRRFWIRGFVLVLGFALIASLAWFFIRGTRYSAIPHKAEETPQAPAQPSQRSPADNRVVPTAPKEATDLLKSQLQQVIDEIKEAHLKKDLSKLLSYYSPNFPGLPQRTQSISKAWKIYDYPKIAADIKDIKLLPDNTALVRVQWDAEAKNISTQKSKNISKTYLIRFGREAGQWRIKTLDNVD